MVLGLNRLEFHTVQRDRSSSNFSPYGILLEDKQKMNTCIILLNRGFVVAWMLLVEQVAFVQTPQRFRMDLTNDPLGNHAISQVSEGM